MSLFYSQKVEKRTTENLCVRCEVRFKQWSEYHAHVTGPKCTLKLVPLNTSGRSKAQIVKDVEATRLKPYLITKENVNNEIIKDWTGFDIDDVMRQPFAR